MKLSYHELRPQNCVQGLFANVVLRDFSDRVTLKGLSQTYNQIRSHICEFFIPSLGRVRFGKKGLYMS